MSKSNQHAQDTEVERIENEEQAINEPTDFVPSHLLTTEEQDEVIGLE